MRRYTTQIEQIYGATESRAVIRFLLEDSFSMSYADALCGGIDAMDDNDRARLDDMVRRLRDGEPLQYVTGKAWFANRCFAVEPGVLIPRPETAELCQLIKDSMGDARDAAILDIGTGSGCIAITLALDMPGAHLTAMDVSDEALRIASANARMLGAEVTFVKDDILKAQPQECVFDCIVSNPPYICHKEKQDMERNVLAFEPHLALFVPDDDPLLFYRSIARYALTALKPQGSLFFEANALYATDTAEMLSAMGYGNVEQHSDAYGKPRMVVARKAHAYSKI